MKKTPEKIKSVDAVLPDIEDVRHMVRLLSWKHRVFLEDDAREHTCPIPKGQLNQLMAVRSILPCNLGRIMNVTGLTPPGASLFVNKLVKQGYLNRKDDPEDRRNVLISLTPKGEAVLSEVDERLNQFVLRYLDTCSKEEWNAVVTAARIICRKLAI